MPFSFIIWDLDDEPEGNVQHCLEHGVTKQEVVEVVESSSSRRGISRSSGLPALFGDTRAGRHLIVIYEVVDEDTIRPVTAYDVDRSTKP